MSQSTQTGSKAERPVTYEDVRRREVMKNVPASTRTQYTVPFLQGSFKEHPNKFFKSDQKANLYSQFMNSESISRIVKRVNERWAKANFTTFHVPIFVVACVLFFIFIILSVIWNVKDSDKTSG